jgi:hypothetical protein
VASPLDLSELPAVTWVITTRLSSSSCRMEKVVQHAVVASIEILEPGETPGALVAGGAVDGAAVGGVAVVAAHGGGLAGLVDGETVRVEGVIVTDGTTEALVVTVLLVDRRVALVTWLVAGSFRGEVMLETAGVRLGRTRKMTPARTAAATAATTATDPRRPPGATTGFRWGLACRRGLVRRRGGTWPASSLGVRCFDRSA